MRPVDPRDMERSGPTSLSRGRNSSSPDPIDHSYRTLLRSQQQMLFAYGLSGQCGRNATGLGNCGLSCQWI